MDLITLRIQITFIIDTINPIITITSPPLNDSLIYKPGTPIYLNYTVEEQNNYACYYNTSYNSSIISIGKLNETLYYPEVGINDFEIFLFCTDYAGNTGHSSVLVKKSQIVPTITILSPTIDFSL